MNAFDDKILLRLALVMASMLVPVVSLGCAGARHVRMNAPATAPGSRYACTPIERGSSEIRCQPATSDVPAEENKDGTLFFNLPSECEGRFNQIIVYDAESGHPKLAVKCAPREPSPCGAMPP
jgi:hypothetical protein